MGWVAETATATLPLASGAMTTAVGRIVRDYEPTSRTKYDEGRLGMDHGG
jgi:hypothetical protein